MLSFGEKLRKERESRDTALEEVARRTKIQSCFLEALERNEFEALPGRSFGKLYIRAYADLLGFDPRPLIAAYDREHQSQARRALEEEAAAAEREAAAETSSEEVTEFVEEPVESPVEKVVATPREEPVEVSVEEVAGAPPEEPAEASREQAVEAPEDRPVEGARQETVATPQDASEAAGIDSEPRRVGSWRAAPDGRRTALVAAPVVVGLLALTLWVYFAFFRTGASESEPPADAVPSQVEASEGAAEPPARDELPIEAIAAKPPPESAAAPPTGTARLSVPEFGVGRRVVNHRLVGQGRRFEEGTVVWFWTRVLGGGPGERIRHVWLHEGKPVESTELKLGGPHWRTHSRKTLRGVGEWAVEARDSKSRVLARTTFTCTPAGSWHSPSEQ